MRMAGGDVKRGPLNIYGSIGMTGIGRPDLSVHVSIREVEHLSYLQKVWLTLVWYECLHPVDPGVEIGYVRPEVAIANPGIVDSKLRASFDAFLSRDARLGAQ